MNRKTVLAFVIALGMILLLFLWREEGNYAELVFSKTSGFYEKSFELALYAPLGAEIYYTLDGSDPDREAMKYTNPIHIEDASNHENIYSMRNDMQPNPWYIPDYSVDKCTIVKALYYDSEGNASPIRTESYFVGFNEKAGYCDINIISIVADPDSLFGYEQGIYVLGKVCDEMSSEDKEALPGYLWNTNYNQRGIEWERVADIQIYNKEKELLLNQKCGVRIQGGASRSYVPKSLNLYARKRYGGENRFYIDLFHTGYMADKLTLFTGGNDYEGKLRDMLTARLVKSRNFATMSFEPYAMFLNGEYWGVYWLTEKYNDSFLEYYYGTEKDNVIMIKADNLEEGEVEDITLYLEMVEYIKRTDFTIQENYEQACKLIDMQSFIDYYATEVYIGRQGDWPAGNFALWRTREIGEGEYEDGKWRWMLFDVNGQVLSNSLSAVDTLKITMDASTMFRNLCQNNDFKRQFSNTLLDLSNTVFKEENVNSIIDSHISLMSEPMQKHIKRFFGTDAIDIFLNVATDVRNFFENRKPYIVQYLKDDFGLMGELATLEIEINNRNAGKIIVNTTSISFEDGMHWVGEYYTDYPIELTAIPNTGYRFARWENGIASDEENIVVNMENEGILIRAVFEPIW